MFLFISLSKEIVFDISTSRLNFKKSENMLEAMIIDHDFKTKYQYKSEAKRLAEQQEAKRLAEQQEVKRLAEQH
ncbi:hypothetical protein [Candidatus Photodesmus anomalopis]|uniref:hypothetical protein n=1 Tax=Candidatus Photodesmus anomalopis TaxID=28176 RepID=UPI00058BBA62|nr:hypothetical protein [Candidatus Photodesmus katoptron]